MNTFGCGILNSMTTAEISKIYDTFNEVKKQHQGDTPPPSLANPEATLPGSGKKQYNSSFATTRNTASYLNTSDNSGGYNFHGKTVQQSVPQFSYLSMLQNPSVCHDPDPAAINMSDRFILPNKNGNNFIGNQQMQQYRVGAGDESLGYNHQSPGNGMTAISVAREVWNDHPSDYTTPGNNGHFLNTYDHRVHPAGRNINNNARQPILSPPPFMLTAQVPGSRHNFNFSAINKNYRPATSIGNSFNQAGLSNRNILSATYSGQETRIPYPEQSLNYPANSQQNIYGNFWSPVFGLSGSRQINESIPCVFFKHGSVQQSSATTLNQPKVKNPKLTGSGMLEFSGFKKGKLSPEPKSKVSREKKNKPAKQRNVATQTDREANTNKKDNPVEQNTVATQTKHDANKKKEEKCGIQTEVSIPVATGEANNGRPLINPGALPDSSEKIAPVVATIPCFHGGSHVLPGQVLSSLSHPPPLVYHGPTGDSCRRGSSTTPILPPLRHAPDTRGDISSDALVYSSPSLFNPDKVFSQGKKESSGNSEISQCTPYKQYFRNNILIIEIDLQKVSDQNQLIVTTDFSGSDLKIVTSIARSSVDKVEKVNLSVGTRYPWESTKKRFYDNSQTDSATPLPGKPISVLERNPPFLANTGSVQSSCDSQPKSKTQSISRKPVKRPFDLTKIQNASKLICARASQHVNQGE